MKFYAITKKDYLILAFIVLIATVLRLGDGAKTTHFRYDQARLSQLALEMAHGENIPLLGIESSAGVPNSPMTVYFLAPLFAISSNPLFVAISIAIWNVIGVGLLWAIAHRYFGRQVALVSAFAYAISPWAIFYSRSIWAQDYHTPIILLGIGCAFLGFFEKRYWAQALSLPLLIIGFQIHFAAWTLLPLYIGFLWLGRKNIRWSALLISLFLTILAILPFAIGISQQTGGTSERVQLITTILSDGIAFRWYPVSQVLHLLTGATSDAETVTGILRIFYTDWLWGWLVILAIIGAVAVFRPIWRQFSLIVWVWAGITLLAFIPIWTGSGVYLHYFIPTLPALFLLVGLGLSTLVQGLQFVSSRSLSRALEVILYSFTAFILLSQAVTTLQSYQARDEAFTYNPDTGQTATPLHHLLEVREVLQNYDDIILLGANPHESNYYIWEPLLYDTATCVRDLLILDGVIDILPRDRFAVVVAPLSPINANYQVPERYQHDDPIIMPLRDGEDPYIIYPFDTAPEWTETPIEDIDAPIFDAGIRLTGYYLAETFIRLQWHVSQAPGNSYQYFVHFLDENGEKIGQRDGPHYVGQHWCEGDTLITGTFIDLPQDTVLLRVGLYTIDADGGTMPSNLLDAQGQVVGEWVDIPLMDP